MENKVMVKSYHPVEIISGEMSDSNLGVFKNEHSNEAQTKTLQFSNANKFLDESAVWKAALQVESLGID
ncbi:MAG TPA: hypothetical protein VGM58_05520 [Verrucomicrobiae bacterium]